MNVLRHAPARAQCARGCSSDGLAWRLWRLGFWPNRDLDASKFLDGFNRWARFARSCGEFLPFGFLHRGRWSVAATFVLRTSRCVVASLVLCLRLGPLPVFSQVEFMPEECGAVRGWSKCCGPAATGGPGWEGPTRGLLVETGGRASFVEGCGRKACGFGGKAISDDGRSLATSCTSVREKVCTWCSGISW